jgi:hypothetical protein
MILHLMYYKTLMFELEIKKETSLTYNSYLKIVLNLKVQNRTIVHDTNN